VFIMTSTDSRSFCFPALLLVALLTVTLLAGCGGGDNSSNNQSQNLTGLVTVTISDPPTCTPPNGPYTAVWVTITRVRAHTSDNANGNGAGWVDLVDLTDDPDGPMQVNLLGTDGIQCILAELGSTTALPAGNYQQIRLHLLSNNPAGGEATPATNNCDGTGGFNCVDGVGGVQLLNLSSQANNGIKIPPGQIAGGALRLEAGQTADINIHFNACNSIVVQGNGGLRLKPTLHAGEVSATDTISGRAVVTGTTDPPPNATIIVLAEQPDPPQDSDPAIDRVIMQTMADPANGTFSLCPLPPGNGNYDIVVAAQDGTGVTYNATVTFGVPAGTAMGEIPLVPETGISGGPAKITGLVTTQAMGGTATEADIVVSALQEGTPDSGPSVLVTIPLFGASTDMFNTVDNGNFNNEACPADAKCSTYELFMPASNPHVGTFNSGGTMYTMAPGDILYQVNARAFIPDGSSDPNCTDSSLLADEDNMMAPLAVTAGMSTTAETLVFTGCDVAP
jgi:hypothetical protein